jgi:nicotinate-nucleotide adenylyltransferase
MARIGLLGGTFDPPHFGHLLVAQEALYQCGLEKIWFIPSSIPPHKINKRITDDAHRIAMVREAITENPYFEISLIEFERAGRSYTIDTIKELKRKFRNDDFYFIIGADMINNLPNWKSIDELIEEITFIGVKRPGYIIESPYQNKIIQIDVPGLEISSSDLRARFQNSHNTRYLLPETVRKYIEVNGIYG